MGTTSTLKPYGTVLRLTAVLAGRVKGEVQKRQLKIGKFSINDWLVEAVMEKLDGRAGGIGVAEDGGQGVLISGLVAASVLGPRLIWNPYLRTIDEKAEGDPVGAQEDFLVMCPGFGEGPKEWPGWDRGKRGRWLDRNYPLKLGADGMVRGVKRDDGEEGEDKDEIQA